MLRSSPASSMQKTYDDCYLICSTAVYFEKQNNEEEALRSWRNALDSIYYHNAYRIPANYKPKSETERALQQSLRDMEMQCKDRVDLLDALRTSRQEAANKEKEHNLTDGQYYTRKELRSSSGLPANEAVGSPSFGQGPIPTVNYPDLAHPPLPPRPNPPQRPALAPYKSSSSLFSNNEASRSHSMPRPPAPRSKSPPRVSEVPRKTSRTPSPEKKPGMLRTTLRQQGKEGSRVSSGRLSAATMRPRPPAVAGKAATLAWPSTSQPSSRVPSISDQAPPANQTGKSNGSYNRPPSPSEFLTPPSPRLDPPSNERSGAGQMLPPTRQKKLRAKNIGGSSHRLDENASRPEEAPPPPPHRMQDKKGNARDDPSQSNGRTLPLGMPSFPSYRQEFRPTAPAVDPKQAQYMAATMHGNLSANTAQAESPKRHVSPVRKRPPHVPRKAVGSPAGQSSNRVPQLRSDTPPSSSSEAETTKGKRSQRSSKEPELLAELAGEDPDSTSATSAAWDARVAHLMKNLPKGVDEQAAKSIFNEIVIKGDEVHWEDVAGLDIAKNALKEAVVYPFLRPDLFMGLREPARGMLLFGPPGTGKTMLARAVATESKSTFFAISASSLTSKYLGESEKLVRALFSIAKALTPAIIFVDEIDSLLSQRAGSGEHEATRRIKTEFLIQWSDLAKAAAGREDKNKNDGDASRVLVLAATNLPWAIDEAARRRFVRRQYIPLPEPHVRESQLRRLLAAQKQTLNDRDLKILVKLTDGFSGSDITALAKDAAMGPLRSLGEQLLHMSPEDIRPIGMEDFEHSLVNIRPSVSKEGLQEFEDWAKQFGERGG